MLRRALGRAGIVTGYVHVCRKKGCGHSEAATNAAPRHCPKDKMKLWVKPQVRRIRFHDLRHTTGSLLFQTGANPAAVQRILRHSDPRITTEVYGHLAPDYLKAEVDRLRLGAAPETPPAEIEQSREPAAAVAVANGATVNIASAVPVAIANAPPVAVANAEPFAAYMLQDAKDTPQPPTNPTPDQQQFQAVALARHRGFEPLTFGSGGRSGVLGGGSSGSQGGGRIREPGVAGFQPSQSVGTNRQYFAASLLQGAGGLRAVDGGKDRLLSVRQVAERLGVCTATVYTLCEQNELAHVRVLNAIRVAPADLARFVAAARRGR